MSRSTVVWNVGGLIVTVVVDMLIALWGDEKTIGVNAGTDRDFDAASKQRVRTGRVHIVLDGRLQAISARISASIDFLEAFSAVGGHSCFKFSTELRTRLLLATIPASLEAIASGHGLVVRD
jgi:hypothetical protein